MLTLAFSSKHDCAQVLYRAASVAADVLVLKCWPGSTPHIPCKGKTTSRVWTEAMWLTQDPLVNVCVKEQCSVTRGREDCVLLQSKTVEELFNDQQEYDDVSVSCKRALPWCNWCLNWKALTPDSQLYVGSHTAESEQYLLFTSRSRGEEACSQVTALLKEWKSAISNSLLSVSVSRLSSIPFKRSLISMSNQCKLYNCCFITKSTSGHFGWKIETREVITLPC